ncbi:hypothetical protein CsSME_00008970 [Camellia sinensis var. sinensis]
MAERWTRYVKVEQSEHSRKPSQDQEPKQMQYRQQEVGKYSEQSRLRRQSRAVRIVSKVAEKIEQANVPSWDSCASNDPSDGRKHTHLDLIAPSWAL